MCAVCRHDTMDTAAGQKAVAKRRSLGSILRSRLSRAVKPTGRSLSADRAAQRPSDVEAAERDPATQSRPPQPTYRTSAGKSPSTQTQAKYSSCSIE